LDLDLRRSVECDIAVEFKKKSLINFSEKWLQDLYKEL